MTHTSSLLALASVILLVGCSSPSMQSPRVVQTPVRVGMTAVDLKAAYGEPLRIERRADGSANWYYHFGTQQRESAPFSTSEVTETERSHSFGETSTTTTTMSEAAIRVSPSGRVIGPVPAGHVVVQKR